METLLFSAGALAAYMTALFVIALIRKDNGTADIGYGIGFIVATFAALWHSGTRGFALALVALICIWGVRLATRIFLKNRGKPEDFRYRAWREAWGRTFIVRSFLQIYMLQGCVILIVASPVLLSLAYPREIAWWPLIAGIALWCVGFFFEAVGDWQLDRFIKDTANKGKIMTEGLWRYSRHPNYFGECLMWSAVAIAASALTDVWLPGFLSPILITYLLLKVSGVPMLEKRWEGNPEWEAYKARTSVLIPWPPRAL